MSWLKSVYIVLIMSAIPALVFGGGIPGLEGLKEVSDEDLQEICGSIVPDDRFQMVRSQGAVVEDARHAGTLDPSIKQVGMAGASANQGMFDIQAFAKSVTGGVVSMDMDTSGLNQTVRSHNQDLNQAYTRNNVMGGGGFDYSATGNIKLENPSVLGVDMSGMGDFSANIGVSISASVSVVP